MTNFNVLDAEKKIGIETFLTSKIKGVGGRLRSRPQDFKVFEIPSDFNSKKGKFTVAKVDAVNWETNLLVREISKHLHISRKRINFAGTKDKRAYSSQMMSFYKVDVKEIEDLSIDDVDFKDIHTSSKPVKIGDLKGNHFDILVRNIQKDVEISYVQDITNCLKEVGGFPNFFGVQRFGAVRPITHVVGRNLVDDDLEKAVMSYIANPIDGENKESYKLREKLEQTRDYKDALVNYPNYLNYEKAIINKLVEDSNDYTAALKQLPKNLLTMFIYAYQSYIFNKILSERIKKNLPLNQAVEGDIILPKRTDKIDPSEPIWVKNSNIDKVNRQIKKGKAFVSSILLGYETDFSKGVMGEIEQKIVEDEKINTKDFVIPEIPFISSSGTYRPLLASFENLEFSSFQKDDLHKDKKTLNLSFDLNKGSYATCILREFMKTSDIRYY